MSNITNKIAILNIIISTNFRFHKFIIVMYSLINNVHLQFDIEPKLKS